jgi:hypothetical protein
MLQKMQSVAKDDAKFAKAMLALGAAFASALTVAIAIVAHL